MARTNAAEELDEGVNNGGADDVPEPSLREEIEAARDEVIDRQSADAGGDAGHGPGRDASGRFTKRDPAAGDGAARGASDEPQRSASGGDPAAASQPGSTAQAAPVAQPSAASSQQAAASSFNTQLAPQGWTPAGKALWASLPEAARAEITRREADMHRQFTTQDAERSLGREISQIAQQHQQVISRSGITPTALFSEFVGRMSVLQGTDIQAKAAMLREIAQRNGIDARTLLGIPPQAGAQPAPGQQPAAPALTPLPPAFQQMQREWQEFKDRQQTEARERQQREEQEVLTEIMAFRSRPEIRFFDEVRDPMVALLNGGVASTLEEAYNMAIYARPDIRAILEQEARDKANAQVNQRQRVAQARAKGGSVRGGSGNAPVTTPQNRSLREELQAGFAEARSRV